MREITIITFYFFLLSLLNSISMTKKLQRKTFKRIMNFFIYGFCYGCVIWQAVVCFDKYLAMPTAANLEIVSTADVSISFTFCKIVYDLNRNIHGSFFNTPLESLVEIQIFSNSQIIYLKKKNESVEFDYMTSLPNTYVCKEFALLKKVEKVIITKTTEKNNNFHLFIHPTNMINIQDYVIQFPNKVFHNDEKRDGFTDLKFEAYDVTNSADFHCGDTNFQYCKDKKILEEYQRVLGCAYPLQRYNANKYKNIFN